jgi:hypothetical protein
LSHSLLAFFRTIIQRVHAHGLVRSPAAVTISIQVTLSQERPAAAHGNPPKC